jgi:hypothetical protein
MEEYNIYGRYASICNMTVYAQWRARSGDNEVPAMAPVFGGRVSPDGAIAQDGSAAIISLYLRL